MTNDDSTDLVEELNPAIVVQRKAPPLVEWVEVEGEVVAWNEDTQELHLLDPIASLVFQLCDGTATLEVNISELAQAFGQQEQVIRGDVSTCTSNLISLGLVEVVQ